MDMNQGIETRTPNGNRGQRSAARRWASSPSVRVCHSQCPQFLVRNFYVKNSEFLRNFYVEIASWMLVRWYRIQGTNHHWQCLDMSMFLYWEQWVKKQLPKRETRLACLSCTCSLILSFLIPWFVSFRTVLWTNHQNTVLFIKNKKRNCGTRGKRRRPKGVEWPACPRWETRPGWSILPRNLSYFGPQFLRRNRFWMLPVEQRTGTNRTDRFVSHCLRGPFCTTQGVYGHIIWLVWRALLNIVKTDHRDGHWNQCWSGIIQRAVSPSTSMRLQNSDLHRPINNSDGRPLGLPSDSDPAHKSQKLDTHAGKHGYIVGTVPETGLKTATDRSMGKHGKITLFGKGEKKMWFPVGMDQK